MLAMSAAAFAITRFTKNYSLTVILSIIVFAFPPSLSLCGFLFMDYFLATPMLLGNVLV